MIGRLLRKAMDSDWAWSVYIYSANKERHYAISLGWSSHRLIETTEITEDGQELIKCEYDPMPRHWFWSNLLSVMYWCGFVPF